MDARSAGSSCTLCCDTVFEQPYGSSFGLRDFRWDSTTNPVEDVVWMKPPSSDAEALRSEQSAPVCATNGLFVTADELGHFPSVQQPVRQALRLVRGCLLGDSILDSIRFRIRVLVPHSLLRGSTPNGDPPESRQGDDQRTGCRTRDDADTDVVVETTSREAPPGSEGPEVDHRSGGRLGGPAAGGT